MAASHRQQRARKPQHPDLAAAPPDDAGQPTGPGSQGRTTALLCGVLAVQAALSLRLVWSNTASQDEATSLWAGHLIWSHWLHGATVPPFQAYLPGAPVMYPPIGALADHFAGLAGARLLSLALMLGVTALLWSTAARLFGRPAAFFGAALFAVAAARAARDERRARLTALLAVAGLIVPAEQILQGAVLGLDTHVVAGAWFAAIAAGYLVHQLLASGATPRTRTVICGACAAALVFPLTLGAGQSRALFTAWPRASSLIAIMRPLAAGGSEHMLVEDPNVAEFYLPAGRHWARWSSTRNIVLPSGKSILIPVNPAGVVGAGAPDAFAKYIASGYFSLIALNFADTTALDHRIAADIRLNHHYKVVEVVPYGPGPYVIWKYQPHAAVQHYQPTIGSSPAHRHHRGTQHRSKRQRRAQR